MLNADEETALVDYILYMGRHNFPLTRDNIPGAVFTNIPSPSPILVLKLGISL